MENSDDNAEKILEHLTDDEVIDLFVKGIMQEKGSNVGSEQMQDDMFNDLKTRLLQQIDRSLVGALPDDKLEQLNDIATKQGQIDPKIVAQMIDEAQLNVEEIVGITMARFRDIYLGDTKAVGEDNHPNDEAEQF